MSPNPPRVCARCGALHGRKHPYCPDCMREYKRDRGEAATGCEPGTPPPVPPGFDPRDRFRGRPVL